MGWLPSLAGLEARGEYGYPPGLESGFRVGVEIEVQVWLRSKVCLNACSRFCALFYSFSLCS